EEDSYGLMELFHAVRHIVVEWCEETFNQLRDSTQHLFQMHASELYHPLLAAATADTPLLLIPSRWME
ncbi:hypothetical protein Tco_0587340, partial [Tanacetum coccineum]